MSQNIIGTRYGSLFQTNAKTSEKYNCQAKKDYNKKKRLEHQKLLTEINRRTAIDDILY